MDSSSSVALRTRSRRSRGSWGQYDFKYLGESSGKSSEHEIDMKIRKRKNLSRSIETKTRKKRKTKHQPNEMEINEDGFQIITLAEFRNSRSNRAEGIELECITKDEFENRKRNDEVEFQHDRAEGDEIEKDSETESQNSLRHDHEVGDETESDDEEGIEIEMIDETEFRNDKKHDHAEGVEFVRGDDDEGIEVERISETDYGNKRKRHNHAEQTVMEGSCKYSSEKGHKYEYEVIDLEGNDYETNKESGRNRLCSSDSEGNVEKNISKDANFQENEMRSQGSGHETDICIESRTRLKGDIANKPLEVDNNVSADSWSSLSESDDEEDEDFIAKDSDCSDSMELSDSYVEEDEEDEDFIAKDSDCSDSMEISGSYVEEGEEHEKMKRSVKKFYDSNYGEESIDQCASKTKEVSVNLDASSEVNESEAEVEVNNFEENDKRTARNVGDSSNVQEDIVKSSLDSNQMFTQKGFKEHEVVDKIHSGKKNVTPSTDTKSSGVGKATGGEEKEDVNRYSSRKVLQREGKRMKSHEASHRLSCKNVGNDEDGDRATKFDTRDHTQRNKCARNEEGIDMFGKTEWPTRCPLRPQKDHEFCKNLLDAVLDEGAEIGVDTNRDEGKKSSEHEDNLPLRFKFEDEVPRQLEKSEFEVMLESLFDEMERCLKYGNMGFSGNKEVEKDDANPDGETNQYALCRKGKHYLIQDDELGLICMYCLHIELEAKHIIPPWAERTYRGADRRLSGDEQDSVLDGLKLEQDENITGSCNLSTGTIWDIKPGIKQTMYEHQREGLEFLWKNLAGTIYLNELRTSDSCNIGGCIISHAPGTGKTRLTMVFIETYLKLFPNCRPLIIAPSSMLLTWEEEFRKWGVEFPFHNLNNLEMSGKENKSVLKNLQEGKSLHKESARVIKIYSWNKEKSILGMSYRLFEILAGKKSKNEVLKTILLEKTGLVVLDEGHTPRSRKSNIWNALLELKTMKRIILSGTPFQNNFEELFNILRIVRPAVAGVLAKERIFSEITTSKGIQLRKKYKNDEEECQETNTNHAIEELKAAMAPFVHVHKGTILQQSLPGLRDCVVLLKPPPLQKSLIERIEVSQSSLKFDHKVASISVHPYLFKHCRLTETEREGIDLAAVKASKLNPSEGVKTRYVMELVRLCVVRNEKVLIFSQYIKPLKLIQRHIKELLGWTKGKHVLKMQGDVGQRQRQDLINTFNDPKSEAKVLLASTKCCSEGINLVGASRVVLLDVVWNPSVERQAISRAYRLGQKKVVYTYHLMTSGTTEGDKYCRQAEKERLSELVFTSSSNEKCKVKNSDVDFEDEVLEDMVENGSLKDMFEKIIFQPKEKNLMETFSIAG